MGLSVDSIVEYAASQRVSDIHLVKGLPPKGRIDGQLENLTETPLTDEDCEMIAKDLAGDLYPAIRRSGELDLAKSISGERVRINLFRQQGSISAVLRILSNKIPKIDALGLPPAVSQFPSFNKGIVLVTGETGSGKSTTLAAILDEINHTRKDHIITLEDPIEYVYTPDKCCINQREIGKDTDSYADALRAVLREDPDIILIGEMRDLETIETALTAAETGHLVFATLHTNSAVDSINRIVGVFPEARQTQIRVELASTLKAILSQQLLVRAGGKGRAAACEVMVVTGALRAQIREGKDAQMQSSLLSSASQGSITMDNCLIDMVGKGIITPETAFDNCADKDYMQRKMGMGGGSSAGGMGGMGGAHKPGGWKR